LLEPYWYRLVRWHRPHRPPDHLPLNREKHFDEQDKTRRPGHSSARVAGTWKRTGLGAPSRGAMLAHLAAAALSAAAATPPSPVPLPRTYLAFDTR